MKCLGLGTEDAWNLIAGGDRSNEAMESRVGAGSDRACTSDCTAGCSGARATKVHPARQIL